MWMKVSAELRDSRRTWTRLECDPSHFSLECSYFSPIIWSYKMSQPLHAWAERHGLWDEESEKKVSMLTFTCCIVGGCWGNNQCCSRHQNYFSVHTHREAELVPAATDARWHSSLTSPFCHSLGSSLSWDMRWAFVEFCPLFSQAHN